MVYKNLYHDAKNTISLISDRHLKAAGCAPNSKTTSCPERYDILRLPSDSTRRLGEKSLGRA